MTSYRYFLFVAILISGIIALQYDLWFSRNGIVETHHLRQAVVAEARIIKSLEARNSKRYSEILSLRHSGDVLEGLAREDLGYIKKGELFYQWLEVPGEK
ncbi:MAG: FtsB family cell division protein [Francisellaceae bacterium]